MKKAAAVLLLSLTACAGAPPAAAPAPAPGPAPAPQGPTASAQPAAPKPAAPQWKTVDTNPQPGAGRDFKTEVEMLYRVVACGGEAEVPGHFDSKVVGEHCKRLRYNMQGYRDKYLTKAQPFFVKIRPKDLPPTVVYPFGGGDLISAMTTFPDAKEYTTISLEFAGDPRRLTKKIPKKRLDEGLKLIDKAMYTQLRGKWNWTRNMEAAQKAGVPEQIAYALVAMVVFSYEPISLRYFKLKRDGSIHYLDDAEIEKLADRRPEALRYWGAPDYSKAFSNMEMRFQKKGGGEIKIFRHLAANLSDDHMTRDRDHLTKDPSLMAHLEPKGKVSTMTRAASHLLWNDKFSVIRKYLIEHLVWMPSDSTGIPPPFAKAAGLVQDTYGEFTGAYEPSDQGKRRRYNDAFRELFAKNPKHPLDFLYGYPDNNKNGHMIVTRRP